MEYSGILMEIEQHFHALNREVSLALFENRKKYPDFGKKDPDHKVPLSKGPSSKRSILNV